MIKVFVPSDEFATMAHDDMINVSGGGPITATVVFFVVYKVAPVAAPILYNSASQPGKFGVLVNEVLEWFR